ncbi:lysine--tRNA ligase [bacterium]|nr:lysine--tRNA ligase [bacterium]
MEKKNEQIETVETHSPSAEHEFRVKKVHALREQGIEPWPADKPVTHSVLEVLADYQDAPVDVLEQAVEKKYIIAGRIIAKRSHGKSAFAVVQDSSGRMQVYVKQDILGDELFQRFEHALDVGDIVWFSGSSFKTKTGEVTLKVQEYTLLSKCLHPLPEKFHGIADVEIKYRQRYLDLISSPESKHKFLTRSKVISFIRHYLEQNGFVEVETPMLHPIPGGAAARPFVTHHNALGSDFYLRIAPELYLKRLVIGGIERVYEINRNFRNEGISTRHNPEFTMLEFYWAHHNYTQMMDFVEQLIKTVIQGSLNTLQAQFGEKLIDFSKPFARLTVQEAIIAYGDIKAQELDEEHIDETLKKYKVHVKNKNASVGEKLFILFEEVAEHKLIQPTYIIGYPIETSPLAKRDAQNPAFAARFELFIAGMEISNGFNELNEPFDQEERFKDQVKGRESGDDEAHHYDEDFIKAIQYGLPPTVGCGIGIDRLVMLATGTTSIKDVILFPTLKKA